LLIYTVRRIIGTIPVLLLITLLVFGLLQLAPGDPADILLPEEATHEDIAEARARWGLDKPFHEQYLNFLTSAVKGDFGESFRYKESVIVLLAQRFPATLELAFFATLFALLIGVPLGVWAGARPNSWIDNLGSVFGFFGISMPSFWMGIMLILIVSGFFNLLPSAGRETYGVAGESITGFYTIDSLIKGNWIRDPGRYPRGIRHDRAGKGFERTNRAVAPCRAQRDDYHRHRRRARARDAAVGLDHRRNRVRLAGDRQLADQRAWDARLSADHRCGPRLHRVVRDRKLPD
jgi:hypothetical protein